VSPVTSKHPEAPRPLSLDMQRRREAILLFRRTKDRIRAGQHNLTPLEPNRSGVLKHG
jgi:hypothetical protein